jgi:hypothetical protein
VAHQSTMSPVLVNNQGQCCLWRRVGLAFPTNYPMASKISCSKVNHSTSKSKRSRNSNKLIAQEATKAHCYLWHIPQGNCIPHPTRRHYPWRDS